MKIGILDRGYAHQRCIIGIVREAEYRVIRPYNRIFWKSLPQRIALHLGLIKRTDQLAYHLNFEFKPLFLRNIDLLHLYTVINYDSKTPWILSLEHGVPYNQAVIDVINSDNADFSTIKGNKEVEMALKACASPNCKKLIAISSCTRNLQLEILKQFPEYEEQIASKIVTLLPPQKRLISNIEEKGISYEPNAPFTFFYVGGQFYRKGGWDAFCVLRDLHKEHKWNFKLILIGNPLELERLARDFDLEDIVTQIRKEADWVEFYPSLPNEDVLRLAKQSHVALLPTWSESFGFSVGECQACGTPVITTSIRSLPEINSDKVGWRIEVPVNPINHPLENIYDGRERFRNIVRQGLLDRCQYVLEHRDEVEKKAKTCLQYIQEYRNPEDYSRQMTQIYQEALGYHA